MAKIQKQRGENSYKPLCLIIMIVLMINLIGISLISAWDFTSDNFKTFEKDNLKYGKAIIWDEGQIGADKKLMEITVTENTDTCVINCYAEGTIILNEKNKVVDSFRFKNTRLNNYQNIDYTFYLKENNEWIEYDGKQKQGEFEWRLEAKKNPYETIDWLGTFFGYEIEEWLLWDSDMALYYNFESPTELVNGIYPLVPFEGTVFYNETNGKIAKGTLLSTNNNLQISSDAFNGTNFNLTRNTSFCMWVSPSVLGNDDVILDYGEGGLGRFILSLDSAGDTTGIQLSAPTGASITKNSGVFAIDEYNHICVVFNSTSVTLYSNGSQIDSDTTNFNFGATSTNNLTLGVNFAGTSELTARNDELGFWNRALTLTEITELYNSGAGVPFGGGDTRVDLNLPKSNEVISIPEINFSANFSANTGNFIFKNSTYYVSYSNGTIFNKTLVTVGTSNFTSLNISGFTPNNYFWNVFACAENLTGTRCIFADDNLTFRAGSTTNAITFNTTTYDTSQENFMINITPFGGTTPTNANLVYDGVSSSASITASDNNFLLSANKIIPVVGLNTNNTFNFTWQLGASSDVSNNTNQTVFPTIFGLCNTTLTTRYINISYKNETTNQERVNATIDSTWTYYLGDGTVTKTLNFANSTEGIEHGFCLSPPDRKLFTSVILNYNNAESQQRRYTDTLQLINVTTQRVLYLLPTSLGIFSTFQTINNVGDPLNLVSATIQRTLGGSIITVASSVTDDSGIVVFFLNPDEVYTATFLKVGFPINTFTFVPITDTRSVIMGGEIIVSNGTQIAYNTTYQITPTNNTLLNNTDVTFGFEVTSGLNINFISMNITNNSGGQIGYQENAGAGLISEVINTGNLTRIIGRYVYKAANETVTISKVWIIGTEFEGDYSLNKQMKLFLDYGFTDFIRLLIVIAVIFGIVIFMSAKEITDTSESKVMVVILLLWVFSLLGWLDTGLISSSTDTNINRLGRLSSQYGIAILSTLAASFFVLRRLFIRRI